MHFIGEFARLEGLGNVHQYKSSAYLILLKNLLKALKQFSTSKMESQLNVWLC